MQNVSIQRLYVVFIHNEDDDEIVYICQKCDDARFHIKWHNDHCINNDDKYDVTRIDHN